MNDLGFSGNSCVFGCKLLSYYVTRDQEEKESGCGCGHVEVVPCFIE